MQRKIRRNLVKKEISRNKIKLVWREMQINAGGEHAWIFLFNQCNRKKHSTAKANMKNVYSI